MDYMQGTFIFEDKESGDIYEKQKGLFPSLQKMCAGFDTCDV